MARDTTVRVNKTELEELKSVRDEYFPDSPLGAVILSLTRSYRDEN